MTKSQALKIAEENLNDVNGNNWTISVVYLNKIQNKIQSLIEEGFEYLPPIPYGGRFAILCHQDNLPDCN